MWKAVNIQHTNVRWNARNSFASSSSSELFRACLPRLACLISLFRSAIRYAILSPFGSALDQQKGAPSMEWTTPQHEEIDLNCEVSSYANAEL